MTINRPNWDKYFLGIAKAVSLRATCPRASVGAVIVDQDNRVVSTGYNGSPPGLFDCMDAGCVIEEDHCQRAIHAEVNAVVFARQNLRGCTLYLYHSGGSGPCRECQKVLAAAGVSW